MLHKNKEQERKAEISLQQHGERIPPPETPGGKQRRQEKAAKNVRGKEAPETALSQQQNTLEAFLTFLNAFLRLRDPTETLPTDISCLCVHSVHEPAKDHLLFIPFFFLLLTFSPYYLNQLELPGN